MVSEGKGTKFTETAQTSSNRLDLQPGERWTRQAVARILQLFPDQERYTVAAGISPSGIVHIGNLRDVMISHAVAQELKTQGKDVRFLFSWDNFDRFRKVPANVAQNWKEHIGKPLSKVPDPMGTTGSYAELWQQEFEHALERLGIQVEYRYQTDLYRSGIYDKAIILALEKRHVIADILLQHMSEKAIREKGIDATQYRAEFCPLTIYSRFTGKDNTKYLDHHGTLVRYRCLETDKEDSIDITREHDVKLGWKVDWPMRWAHEGVVFEPGGKDHAAPDGSYDVSHVIAKEVFNITPPVFLGYEFIGVQGLKGKMSGSAGNAITPGRLLEVFDPSMVHWFYNKRAPNAVFNFDFGPDVIRQYDEFDRSTGNNPPPFRQMVAFGQIVQWDANRLEEILTSNGHRYSPEIIRARMERARNWLETYNPEEAIKLRAEVNTSHANTLSAEECLHIRKLRSYLLQNPTASIADIEAIAYTIPKEDLSESNDLKKAQRNFFENIYILLISQKTGPRLSTFLYAIDRKQALALLDI